MIYATVHLAPEACAPGSRGAPSGCATCSLLGRTPGDEVQVRLYDRHPAIPTAWVDDTFVIKLGAGDNDNAAIRSGLVNARWDDGRSSRRMEANGWGNV